MYTIALCSGKYDLRSNSNTELVKREFCKRRKRRNASLVKGYIRNIHLFIKGKVINNTN